jgi:hypothetical protein
MDDGQIIDYLGGNGLVAKLCEVTPQAVWQWRRAGIPRARLMFLRAVRPDAFELVGRSPVSLAENQQEVA